MSEQQKVGTVEFRQVSKRYRLGALGTLRGAVSALLARNNHENDWRRTIWAVHDVSFTVEPGESLGVIGPNGSGKTTTLKLLSNITRPTSGSISIQGRVAALIELGAGFHPELTGLENIYLNGAILGLSRREISRKLDSIIAFSGLERFMDTPVKRYSSGMYVRLGFAIASHVQADVLLVDEVLAVGDAEFRRKCTERMNELRSSGTTLIFVSHNMYQVRHLCERALLLLNGELRFLGKTNEAISAYERTLHVSVDRESDSEPQGLADGPATLMISDIALLNIEGQPISHLKCEQDLVVQISYCSFQPIVNPIIRIRLIRADGTVCAMTASAYESDLAWTLTGEGNIVLRFEPIQLASGRYLVDLNILDSTDSMLLTGGQSGWFDVEDLSFGHEPHRGIFVPRLRWLHEPRFEVVTGSPNDSHS